MEETKVKQEKPSYEDLERELVGLRGLNNQLLMQLQQANMGNLFKRLDYLFKVVEFEESFTAEFATKCAKEIEEHLTLPEPSEESSENK